MRTIFLTICIVGVFANSGFADGPSTAESGINCQNLGLTGAGVAIGIIEGDRVGSTPALFPFDDAAHSNFTVLPAAVFLRDGTANQNQDIHDHTEHVAGIMISNHGVHRSVALDADLFSSAFQYDPLQTIHERAVIAMQQVAQQLNDSVAAINLSFWINGTPDGNSLLSLAIDWSARNHNVLYSMARGNVGTGIVPSDSFNGIGVAASRTDNGVFRRVWDDNNNTNAGLRRVTSLLAPGVNITSSNLGETGGIPNFGLDQGTSMAAPHVTAVVALLQEYADEQNWFDDARRHEVLKAVLMNSADKLQDNGDGSCLCMEKTIINTSGDDWSTSDAQGPFAAHPVDFEMGTGQLNASRAVKQLAAGQHGPADVPLIGWDYGETSSADNIRKYVLDRPLRPGSYISVTLAWDRVVELNDTNSNGRFDIGESFDEVGRTYMALFLKPKGATEATPSVCNCVSSLYTVQHIFCQIPMEGEYEIWVQQLDAPIGNQSYGLAWWAVPADGNCPADLDENNVVDNFDLFVILSAWGPNCGHPADLTHNGIVDTFDMFELLGAWGQCCDNCPVSQAMSVAYSWTSDSCIYTTALDFSDNNTCPFECPPWSACDLLSHVTFTDCDPEEGSYCHFDQTRFSQNVSISGVITGGQRIGNEIIWTHVHPSVGIEYDVQQFDSQVQQFGNAFAYSDIFADRIRSVPSAPGSTVTIKLNCVTGLWSLNIGFTVNEHPGPGAVTFSVPAGSSWPQMIQNNCSGLHWLNQTGLYECERNPFITCICASLSPNLMYSLTDEQATVTIQP